MTDLTEKLVVVAPSPGTKPTLVTAAYDRLRQDILRGVLRPGERLRLQQIADTYGWSMGAVREALARLVGDNIVEFEERRGFSVPLISHADLVELLGMRTLLEEKALRESIARGGIDWEADLTAAFHRLSRTGRLNVTAGVIDENWERAHAAFHRALVAAYDYPLFHQFLNVVLARSDRYRHLYLTNALKERDHLAEHRAIMDAALRRDADEAVRLMSEHLKRTVDMLLAAGFATASAPQQRGSSGKAR